MRPEILDIIRPYLNDEVSLTDMTEEQKLDTITAMREYCKELEDKLSIVEVVNRDFNERLEKAKNDAKLSSSYHVQYSRKTDILKKTLLALIEKHNIDKADMYATMIDANDLDLDTVLMYLAK